MDIGGYIAGYHWNLVAQYAVKVLAAFVLALPVGWQREQATRIMGLRTFPLVAVASCGYVLVARAFLGPDSQAQARIVRGLMTGIGFIGGGAILKDGDHVEGTATAASVWTTGVVGAAVGYGRLEIALLISLINFLALKYLTPLKRDVNLPD